MNPESGYKRVLASRTRKRKVMAKQLYFVEVRITSTEKRILDFLQHHHPIVQSQLEIIENVWGKRDESYGNSLKTHICHINSKFMKEGLPRQIVGIRTRGYFAVVPSSSYSI